MSTIMFKPTFEEALAEILRVYEERGELYAITQISDNSFHCERSEKLRMHGSERNYAKIGAKVYSVSDDMGFQYEIMSMWWVSEKCDYISLGLKNLETGETHQYTVSDMRGFSKRRFHKYQKCRAMAGVPVE